MRQLGICGNSAWMAGTNPDMATCRVAECKASGESDAPSTAFAGADENYTGKLSCFLPGISTVLPRSIARARAMRERVALGMMTSSI
jgi:hypothetical protein